MDDEWDNDEPGNVFTPLREKPWNDEMMRLWAASLRSAASHPLSPAQRAVLENFGIHSPDYGVPNGRPLARVLSFDPGRKRRPHHKEVTRWKEKR